MTGIVLTPEQLLALATDTVMHGACTQHAICVIVECVFQDENGRSFVASRMGGPSHALVGQSTDPVSFLDIEKLQEFFYPEAEEPNSEGSGVDEDDDEEENA